MLYRLIDIFCGAVVPLVVVAAVCAFSKRMRAGKTALLLLLTLYLASVFDIVGIAALEYTRWNPSVSLIPFADIGPGESLFQVTANVVMFMPLGFLLPLIWPRLAKPVPTILAGALLSLVIEAAQLFSPRVTDIDDLLMNTLGAALGYLILKLLSAKRRQCDRPNAAPTAQSAYAQFAAIVLLTLSATVFVKSPISSAIYSLPLFG